MRRTCILRLEATQRRLGQGPRGRVAHMDTWRQARYSLATAEHCCVQLPIFDEAGFIELPDRREMGEGLSLTQSRLSGQSVLHCFVFYYYLYSVLVVCCRFDSFSPFCSPWALSFSYFAIAKFLAVYFCLNKLLKQRTREKSCKQDE